MTKWTEIVTSKKSNVNGKVDDPQHFQKIVLSANKSFVDLVLSEYGGKEMNGTNSSGGSSNRPFKKIFDDEVALAGIAL